VIGTYLYVAVASLDGATHNVQLYADTSAGTSYFPCTSIRRIIWKRLTFKHRMGFINT
jgi:hypothetical protein